MEQTLKELVEGLLNTLDPSGDVLTESVKTDMSVQFVEAVTAAVDGEKVKIDEAAALQMESLNKQIDVLKESHEVACKELIDEGVAAVALVDGNFADMLEYTVDSFDERAMAELVRVKEVFDTNIETELEDLAESVEQLIENKLEAEVSTEDLTGLAKLEKLEKAFESMRELLFSDVVLDSKVTESVGQMKTDYERLVSQNIAMAKKINKMNVDSFLESETETMKAGQKAYMVERFENAKFEDIKENWEEAQDDFKKLDADNRRLAKEDIEEIKFDGKLDEVIEDEEKENTLSESEQYYANMASKYASVI